jgi:hypothetical protein
LELPQKKSSTMPQAAAAAAQKAADWVRDE